MPLNSDGQYVADGPTVEGQVAGPAPEGQGEGKSSVKSAEGQPNDGKGLSAVEGQDSYDRPETEQHPIEDSQAPAGGPALTVNSFTAKRTNF